MGQNPSGGMRSTMSDSPATRRRNRRPGAKPEPTKTVEQLLASQKAESEAREAELQRQIEELQGQVALSQEQSAESAVALHLSAVRAKAKDMQDAKLPPTFIKRAKEILLAAGPAERMSDEGTLKLSFTQPATEEGGEPVVEEKDLSLSQIIEYLAGGVPKVGDGSDLQGVVTEMGKLHASQHPAEEKDAKEKAEDMYEQAKAAREGTE